MSAESTEGTREGTRTSAPPEAGAVPPKGVATRRSLRLLFLGVFGAFTGQSILFPILPPLGREVGLTEFQVGLLISVSAALVVVCSPWWGRKSDIRGRKPMLLVGMVGSAVSLCAFALTFQLGLAGMLSVPVLFALLLVSRGVLFGASLAAVPVSAQARVADMTEGERERTRGIAAVGAAQGLALVIGPAMGGLLAGPGLLAPLYFAPALVLLIAALVWLFLPRPRNLPQREEVKRRLSPLDPRLWPFLLSGFVLFLSLGVTEITIDLLFQDWLALSATETAQTVGVGLVAVGLTFVFAQAVLVPRLGWPPLRLMRSGIPVALAGFVLLVFATGFVLLVVALALLGLGLGLAIPGYIAAPTLRVERGEQGGVAGLVSATNALTFVLAPALGTALYAVRPEYPYVLSALLISALFVFVVLHPSVREQASQHHREEGG